MLYFGSEIPWETDSCEHECSRLCLLSHSRCWSVFQDRPCLVIHVGDQSRAVSSLHWAGNASLLQVSPARQCCHSGILAWFQRCGTPSPSSEVLCLVLLGHVAEPACWFAPSAAVLQSKLNCTDDCAFPHSCVIFWSLGRSLWLSLHCHSSPWLSWSDQF